MITTLFSAISPGVKYKEILQKKNVFESGHSDFLSRIVIFVKVIITQDKVHMKGTILNILFCIFPAGNTYHETIMYY